MFKSLAISVLILIFAMALAIPAKADTLVLVNNQKITGELMHIAHEYIEFKTEPTPGNPEWLKVYKKHLLAVVNDQGKLIYPRDKFDENALNYGKVRIRNEREKQLYLQRVQENLKVQRSLESEEKNRYKVAALVGGLSGIMLWALLDSKQ